MVGSEACGGQLAIGPTRLARFRRRGLCAVETRYGRRPQSTVAASPAQYSYRADCAGCRRQACRHPAHRPGVAQFRRTPAQVRIEPGDNAVRHPADDGIGLDHAADRRGSCPVPRAQAPARPPGAAPARSRWRSPFDDVLAQQRLAPPLRLPQAVVARHHDHPPVRAASARGRAVQRLGDATTPTPDRSSRSACTVSCPVRPAGTGARHGAGRGNGRAAPAATAPASRHWPAPVPAHTGMVAGLGIGLVHAGQQGAHGAAGPRPPHSPPRR